MFTPRAQELVDFAKAIANGAQRDELGIESWLLAIGEDAEGAVLLRQVIKGAAEGLAKLRKGPVNFVFSDEKLALNIAVRELFVEAKGLAAAVPCLSSPGSVDKRHLIVATALSPPAQVQLGVTPINRESALQSLRAWYEEDLSRRGIGDLTRTLQLLRGTLLRRVFGQDHAVQSFVEGLFNAEVAGANDPNRRSPRAIFTFAGPPGVGKTMLAELGAKYLERPFKRFDMTAFATHQEYEALVGFARTYVNARPGILTDYVQRNENAVLLFDEIEKAHLNAIQLFLQIMDAGVLEDKFTEQNVSFRNITLIFTTNAGKLLYDRPNSSGVHQANTAFHRKTILDALENEKNPATGQPFFPPAICSRMATGFPVLFNRLTASDLAKVAVSEIERVLELLSHEYYKNVEYDPLLATALVLRESAQVDARTLRSQVETFIKLEIFRFCELFAAERLEDVFAMASKVRFSVDPPGSADPDEVSELFQSNAKPRILLVAEASIAGQIQSAVDEVDWTSVSELGDVAHQLAHETVDLVLLDLLVGATDASVTNFGFDRLPPTSSLLRKGQDILRLVRERTPQVPVYLLTIGGFNQVANQPAVLPDDLLLACISAGGARGFLEAPIPIDDQDIGAFKSQLLAFCRSAHQEAVARRLAQENKVLQFDTHPKLDESNRKLTISLRRFRLARAVSAVDTGAVLGDFERPSERFEDVIGANTAKEELRFFCDFLREPRRFAALGVKTPRGVLLHGPPGTGKTMLARAMAGESNAAFISVAATSFVTVWQGSGPQNIREAFARARRYAPCILFIDEIDAIGRERSGAMGGRPEEFTLNALLTEMDGFQGNDVQHPVFVLAATNAGIDELASRRGPVLDRALLRRFDRSILVELPDQPARLKFLTKRLLQEDIPPEKLKELATRAVGWSIADLQNLVETAVRQAIRAGGRVTFAVLEESFEVYKHGESRTRNESEIWRTAWHEAGHVVLFWLSGAKPLYATIVARGGLGGYAEAPWESMRSSLSREEYLGWIRCALAGRAAEIEYAGEANGTSTGAESDLEMATRLALQFVARHGMSEEFGLLSLPEHSILNSPMAPQLYAVVSRILSDQMKITLELVHRERNKVERVAKELFAKNRLSGDEITAILGEAPAKEPPT